MCARSLGAAVDDPAQEICDRARDLYEFALKVFGKVRYNTNLHSDDPRDGSDPLRDDRVPDSVVSVERLLLELFFSTFRDRLSEKEVRQLFGEFGPKTPRQLQHDQYGRLIALLAWYGCPPKKRFAREVADLNRRLRPEERYAAGATTSEAVLVYLNRVLKQKAYRDLLERYVKARRK